MARFVAMGMVSFDERSSADHIYQQTKTVAIHASLNNITESEGYTSYFGVYEEQPDGTLAPLSFWHVDKFGIVREGQPTPVDPPLWVQPLGAADSYPAQDLLGQQTLVELSGAQWLNTHGDGNSWEPGTFGWELVSS